MKRTLPSESVVATPTRPRGPYKASSLTDGEKTAIGKIGAALLGRGFSNVEYLTLLNEAGYPDLDSVTVGRWMTSCTATGLPTSGKKSPGRPSSLSPSDLEVVAGYVFRLDADLKMVTLKTVVDFVLNTFRVSIDDSTASRYLARLGITGQTAHRKSPGFLLSDDGLAKQYLECLLELEAAKFFEGPLKYLMNIDFSYDSIRLQRQKTFAAKGGPQPRSAGFTRRYTNCFTTAVFAGGSRGTVTLMSTCNPAFDFARRVTPAKLKLRKKVLSLMAKYSITKDMIHFVPPVRGRSQTYAAEKGEFVTLLFQRFLHIKDMKNWRVLHDAGNAYKTGGVDVLDEVGVGLHASYTPAVHHLMQINDNCVNAVVKEIWRAMKIDHNDEIESPLALLHCFNTINKDMVFDMFTSNLFLHKKNFAELTVDDMKQKIDKKPENKKMYTEACIEAYNEFVIGDRRGGVPDAPDGCESALDGKGWEEQEE